MGSIIISTIQDNYMCCSAFSKNTDLYLMANSSADIKSPSKTSLPRKVITYSHNTGNFHTLSETANSLHQRVPAQFH